MLVRFATGNSHATGRRIALLVLHHFGPFSLIFWLHQSECHRCLVSLPCHYPHHPSGSNRLLPTPKYVNNQANINEVYYNNNSLRSPFFFLWAFNSFFSFFFFGSITQSLIFFSKSKETTISFLLLCFN